MFKLNKIVFIDNVKHALEKKIQGCLEHLFVTAKQGKADHEVAPRNPATTNRTAPHATPGLVLR